MRRYAPGAGFPRHGHHYAASTGSDARNADRRQVVSGAHSVSGDSSRLARGADCLEVAAEEWIICSGQCGAIALLNHHVMSCLRLPAGRADRNGSQQAAFSMERPSLEPLKADLALCEAHPNARYTVNGEGDV
eukprot:2753761-Pleurochrysis_carterae.AAC.1